MLAQLRVSISNSPLFSIRELHGESRALLLNLSDNQEGLALLDVFGGQSEDNPRDSRPIRWNTQAPNTGYATYLARMAKRRKFTLLGLFLIRGTVALYVSCGRMFSGFIYMGGPHDETVFPT